MLSEWKRVLRSTPFNSIDKNSLQEDASFITNFEIDFKYFTLVHNPCADQDHACKHVDHEHSDLSSQNAESIHLSSSFFRKFT